MNPRIEKLCLPRHRRDAVWKFWQPNAKLQKIHPPIYWKSLDYKQINPKNGNNNKESTKTNHPQERSCSDGCHYTTLIGNEFRVFVDFEHDGLQHATWKESIERERSQIKVEPTMEESPWFNLNNKQQSLNDRYLIRQGLHRYFKSRIQRDNLFELDKTPYPNRPMPLSRRPRDALHIDFYQADHLKGSKIEATFKTFYHRKYLLPRHLREQTLKDLLSMATNAQLDIEIIGHFSLHPNELSKHEIQMFELTSEFGDIYEGHIIRINKEKLVLLLASTYHSHIKFSQCENLQNIPDEPKSTIEQIILNHAREYLQTHTDHSIEQIRRIQIEFEPLMNQEKLHVMIHLLSDDEINKTLTFEITSEQEPELFQKELEANLYFLQGIDEQTMIHSVEDKLKQLFIHQEENFDMKYETMNSLEKMFDAYVNYRLSKYSREECMRIAIEYSFDDLLDELDSNEFQLNKDNRRLKMMIDDVQKRLRSQIERRLEAEATAKILLMGPSIKKEIESTGKEVIVLDHHREIFVTRSDKVKDIQRNHSHVIFHDEIDSGPKRFDRLPMSIDSLTILTRIQQRKRLALEQDENHLVQLGSGIRRLITSENQEEKSLFSVECEQDKIDLSLNDEEEDNHSIRTISINAKSFNTSSHTEQKDLQKLYQVNQQRKNKRISRSPAELIKHKRKRKKCKRDESISKSLDHSMNPKRSFFNNLFLLQQNKKQKMRISIRNRDQKGKYDSLSKPRNANAITEDSNTSTDLNMHLDEQASKHPKLNYSDESIEDEGFQDREASKKSYDTEHYLRSLYGSLSTTMKHAHDMYQSKSSQLRASLDLTHIFITFLHIRKDIASEIASAIITARQRLIQPISTQKSSSSTIIDNDDDDDDQSVSSGIITAEESDTIISENDDKDHADQNYFPIMTSRNENIYSSSSQRVMSRITAYLSEADWRVYNYITKHFLQNGGMITTHALEFSSALLIDLIEDSVYRTYFHLKWCSNSYVKDTLIEQFIKKSIDNLLNHLQLINLPLLENIALMHTLKKYMSTDVLQEFNSMEHHPVPIGHDPCVWFSTDILIKTICSLTDDILNKMNLDYLSDYTKFEYLLISYFRKIEIVQNLQDTIETKQSQMISHNKCLLHVIDLNQAPKFFSDQAFKRFKLGEKNDLDDDVEALKDLVLLDIQKRNIKSVKRPYLPLSMDDLVLHHQNRVIGPSPWILAQYHRRWGAQKTRSDKYDIQKDSYQFDETDDSTKMNNLPPEVRALLNNMIKNYGTIEENLALQATQDQYEGLSEEDVAQLIENAIEAVERFDRENNIGDRKLQNKKTVNDRLIEFFKYAGRHGVRLLDDTLKLAKLRSNDPKKYMPLAVNMLQDRLKQSGTTRMRKQGVRFAHTLETLFTATNDEPELITTLLKKKPLETELDTPRKIMKDIHENTDTIEVDDEFYPEVLLSNSIISQIGLTVAQMVVLATVHNRKPLQLTNTQITQMCLKQNLPKEQWQVYIEKLVKTTDAPDKFLLTEEQLVQIAIEENISIAEVERMGTSQAHFQLNESQIRYLIAQINTGNCTLSPSTASLKQQQLPLILNLDQFIELCDQLKIDINKLFENKAVLQKSSLIDGFQSKFNLTPAQISYLINQAKFDIKKLITIEQNLKKSGTQAKRFRLNSSQLAYLFVNQHIVHDQNITGLSTAQLIALYVLQQQSIKEEQMSLFSLTYQQIQQLALSQNMTLAHFQSLSSSKKPFQLTQDQLIHITAGNKIPIEQIISIHDDQKSKKLDREQLCSLISQNNYSSHVISQRICLNVEQIIVLAKYSDIKLDQLTTCTKEHTNMVEFRFKPEQLAMLWASRISSDDLNHITPLSESSSSSFTLSDEQFSSLLHSVSPSVPSSTLPLIKSNESIGITQNRSLSTLTNQLTAMHERLKSSVQAHVETVNIVSNAMLKRNHIESTLNLVHQLSLHSIDDISNKEVETIPSFVLDLLKMNPITEKIYKSIEQGEITSDMLDKSVDISTNRTIIEGIQAHQLSFPQLHKIQTQLLTPKLIEEFKSGHLSRHVLDAYKSLSPLQIINKVRSSITQLNTLLLQQSPIISQSDTMVASVMQQTAKKNPITTNEEFNADNQEPISIYPDSTILRQQILQELRDRLSTQRIELKKEYGIEPVKGKASIEQITKKLRTMAVIQDLESLIGRQIDEIDILNILEGHLNHLLVQVPADTRKTNELFDRNIQHRLNRINKRIQLVNLLQNHIENERLTYSGPMTPEEFTALVLEDIPKFEQLTGLQLTENDLRIITMNRFASLERSLTRPLTESEYRYLLQTDSPFDYIEQELLKRSLTTEERIEHEELTLLPYQELVHDKTSITYGKVAESFEEQNIKLTYAQLEQILHRRAELVDQYDILHSISPTIKQIEEELDRSLTIDEKKRLTQDDYSMIKQIKNAKYKDIKGKPQAIVPITASLIELVEHTQDKNILENIKYLEADLGRSLTKQELVMVAKGDINSLEKTLEKPLSIETIKSIYKNRFTDLTDELKRNLTDNEIRDILSGELNSIEKALGRQLTSTERLTYKPVNAVDLTASQLLTDTPSIDTTIQELEDVLARRLTEPEIQHLTDQPANLMSKNSSMDLHDSKILEDDWFLFSQKFKQPIRFTLSEIEKAIGKSLNSDELERFAGSRFAQIEYDLGKSLNDLQRSNLLKGDKLTIESLINRKLSSEETGPHLVDLANIERILNRSLTYDELINLSGDRFDDIRRILQRSLTYEELIDLLNGNDEKIKQLIEEKLDFDKEMELKELPINRIRYFENILERKLSPNELLRFAEDRFEPLSRLLSDVMKPEQILDLASGRYDKIETFFNRLLTTKEKYELDKSILQVHTKYPTSLDEIEYIIQRRLSEGELRNLVGDEYQEIEKRLGKALTEKQLRNILHGNDDLLNGSKRKYEDNRTRTRKIVNRLIEKLDEDYREHEKESTIKKSLKSSSSRSSPIQEKQSNVEFHQTTNDLLEQLADDVRKHAIVTPRDHLESKEQAASDKEITHSGQRESIKAFESITRMVEHIADEEHIEEMTTVNDAIDKFQEELPKTVKKSTSNETTSIWLSNLDKRSTSFHLPAIKSIEDRTTLHESHSTVVHPEEDIYLGWTIFKGADRPDLGLKEEKPLMINVKHLAQTYVVGIPEDYADAKSKTIANKIYQGGSILYRSSKSRIIKEMGEFVSQLFHMPIINDATHFIVPSRAYIDIIEPIDTFQSEIIDVEDDELQMRDSPETLEWYEECIQRNVQVHAQIPTGYQPSIVYCHTGRRTVITPAKRAEQRKASLVNLVQQSQSKTQQDRSSIERLPQPMFEAQSIESPSTARTVTDLIMHTVTTTQKTDLLEALEELFSQENLDKYQMTETHWQDIFLILLNSYLRSHALNRKEIFKRLTDKLHELRIKEHRRSSEFYPSISIETKQKKFRFGIRSSLDSMNSGRSPNESEYGITPGQSSHENLDLRSNGNLSNMVSTSSIEHASENLSDTKPYLSLNSNAIIGHQRSSIPIKHRRYRITVMHSDVPSDTSSHKLPSIVSKNRSSQTRKYKT